MRHQDYLDVSESTDVATFQARLVGFAQRLDFGLVTAALAVDRAGQKPLFVMIGNQPEAFLESSHDPGLAKRDPVMRRLKTSSRPFSYDRGTYIEDGADDIWEEQAPFGYGTGIAMALHLPAGKHFLLGVDRTEALPSDDGKLTRMLADLQLLAVYAQEAAIRVLLPESEKEAQVPHLTAREREILAWTRDGKSVWEIAQILALSENTVAFHLKNVMRKFNVPRKQMAVLRAMTQGLI